MVADTKDLKFVEKYLIMKVLITGGCGFLGSNLASSFLAKNDEVFILDNLGKKRI